MRVLKLTATEAGRPTDDAADPLSDIEFVHVKRCLSKLRRLECFEMDRLCRGQELELQQVEPAADPVLSRMLAVS